MVRKRRYIRGLKSGKLFLLLFVLCAALVSCRKTPAGNGGSVDKKEFVKKSSYGLVGYGGYLFKFSDNECQISINKRRKIMRMQNDLQTDYVHMVFAANPTGVEKTVQVEIRYRVGADENICSAVMDNVKVTEKKMWLWDGDRGLGLVIPLL